MSGDEHLRRKALTLTILVLLCVAVGVYGYLAPSETVDTGRIYWSSTGGSVLFEHRAHADQIDNCAACHHDDLAASLANQCRDCHDDDLVADDFSHAELNDIHAYKCTRCHAVTEAPDQKSCRDCHPAAQEGEPGLTACNECHDDDYNADMISHDDMIAIESHTCNSCHVPRSVSDVYHAQCNRCHAQEDQERFVDADGNARCNICHLR